MSLCAPIQDNQVILVHMPPCISPPAPWPLSSAKSYLPSGLYRLFHSFIIYLQCPTDFSLLWHLTKNLMVRYFSPCIHLRSTWSESFWKQRVDRLWAALLQGHFPHSSRRLPFWMCAPLSNSSNHKNTPEQKEKKTLWNCYCLPLAIDYWTNWWITISFSCWTFSLSVTWWLFFPQQRDTDWEKHKILNSVHLR